MAQNAPSGLSHEQEIVLSYVENPQSVMDAIQISRYEELDTCKAIADLFEAGLLEATSGEAPRVPRPWVGDSAIAPHPSSLEPSALLWPLVALGFLLPLTFYVPHQRGSVNMGLASLQPVDVRVVPEGPTRLRQAWALRMASPKDGGVALAKDLGRPMEGKNPVPDLTRLPDPLSEVSVPPPPVSTPK